MRAVSTPVALSLGGNLGDVIKSFETATTNLDAAGMMNMRRSSLYRTKPVGFNSDVPDFINAAVIGEWPHSLSDLHEECKKTEGSLGRPEDHDAWMSRTLDLDIILFGNKVVATESLTIPHPEAMKRFFVLSPLNEIAGNWIFPDTGLSVADALSDLSQKATDNEVMNVVPW